MSEPTASTSVESNAIAVEFNELHQSLNNELKAESATPVHVFNPDDSAEEKKSKVLNHSEIPQAVLPEKAEDSKNNKPAKSLDKMQKQSSASLASTNDSKKATPLYADETLDKNGLPVWYNAGWTAFSQLPNPGDDTAMEDFATKHTPDEIHDIYSDYSRSSHGDYSSDLIAQFIPDKFLGEWYYNCGAVFVAILLTWILMKCHLGLIPCLTIGSIFATFYRTSVKKARKIARDDMQREVSNDRLETDFETVGWINLFLERFWIIFEPALAAQVISQVDTILREKTPGFVDVRLNEFTLGTKAPRVEGIKVYHRSAPDVVCMDWKVSFIPNDLDDLKATEKELKVNPKVSITARVAKGKMGVSVPVVVEDIAFSGKIRIKLKLFNEMPHVKSVDISFLEKPHYDFVLKLLGGDTLGSDVNNIPGLEMFVKDQVTSILGPMMFAPNVFTVDVAALMAGNVDLNSSNGVLAVTVYSGNNLKPVDYFGTLDAYCAFHVNSVHNDELARTAVVENSNHPKWNETQFILLNSLNDVVCINVKDRNSNRTDSDIGIANINLKDVAESDNVLEGLNLVVLRSGKPVGEIKADAHYFPISRPEKKEDGTIVPEEPSNSGIARIYIQDGKDIGQNVKKGLLLGGNVNSYVIVNINGKEKYRTPVAKKSVNPRWNQDFEVFLHDKAGSKIDVTVMNSVDFGEDTVIGRLSSTIEQVENQLVNEKNDWWTLSNGSGQIHLDFKWKPVSLTGFESGLTRGAYCPPIGVVRFKISKANGLKNVEVLTGGKSDPYVRIMSGLQMRGRTDAVLDNLDPVWETPIFVPIHSLREDLSLEVMDFNVNQSDKLLGLCELSIKDIAVEKKSENGQSIYEGREPVKRKVELMNRERKKGRGTLEYEATFYPTLALAKKVEEAEKKTALENDEPKEEAEPSKSSTPLADIAPDTQFDTDLHGEKIHYVSEGKIDLLSYPSGVLSVKIHEASVPSKKKAVAEILIDAVDPQFRTAPVKGTMLNFNESGDAFVRELDLSRVVIRLRDPKDDDKSDHSIGLWSSTAMEIVKAIQNSPSPAETTGTSEDYIQEHKLLGGSGGTIKLSFRYTPLVKFTLDPNDSLENQGNLTVTALSASGLKAADRSGTSDPYCVFSLDGEKVYKTQTYKKQLAPVFKNETFVAPIPQRRRANLDVKIYDWDQIGSNTLLAEGSIPIADLESFAAKEVEVPLEGGIIHLRLKWEPEILARPRAGTTLIGSTMGFVSGGTNLAFNTGGKVLHGGTRVVGDVIGGGTKVVGGVVGGGTKIVGGAIGGGTKIVGGALGGGTKLVGGAIGGGVGALGRGFNMLSGKKSPGMTATEPRVDTNVVPEVDSIPVAKPADVKTEPISDSSSLGISPISPRPRSIFDDKEKNVTIKVNVLEGKNIKTQHGKTSDPYVRIRLGKHFIHKTKYIKKDSNPQWNESFTTPVFETSVLEFVVRDRNTLADSDIGEVSMNVSEYVEGGKLFDGWLPLTNGTGEIHIQLEVVQY